MGNCLLWTFALSLVDFFQLDFLTCFRRVWNNAPLHEHFDPFLCLLLNENVLALPLKVTLSLLVVHFKEL